jgi:hypothetical protein
VDVHSSGPEDTGHSGEAPTVSAEQLAIALMGEARRLYGRCADPYQLIMQHQEVREMADRLAEWATDARKLGVASQQRYEVIEQVRGLLVSVKNSSDPLLWMSTLEEMAVILDV